MRSREAETLLLLPLLPIFLVGMVPILLFAFLGFVGVVLLGILMICAGFSSALSAKGDFSEQVIVHGYMGRSERAVHANDMHSAIRFAFAIDAVGAGLVIAGLSGFFYFG